MKIIKNCVVRSALLCACVVSVLLLHLSASAQTLVNRYSFTDDGTHTNIVDSVGGTNWYGILPNGGDLTDVPGQLILLASLDQYVQLPAGVLSNYTAVTIDIWATFGTLPANCWIYGFGTTDAGGVGQNYIFCQPENGRIAITQTDPGYNGEQGTGGAGNLSGQTVHLTSVYNPVFGYEELYTNGVLVSANNNVTVPMNAISNQLNYIARSLYNADAYMDVQLNEFRIWNGALNPFQVAGCDVAGPDTVGNTASAGTVTSIQISVPLYQLIQGGNETLAVTAQMSVFASPVTITRLAALSSSNTNVLTINPTNYMISAVGQGSANIVATYGSLSSTQTITVVQPASVLAHRYSFNDTDNGSGNVGSSVADSVGGAAGTLPNGGALTGSQLQLSSASAQYVQLSAGIISNYNAVTIDAWVTFPDALPGACWLFGFGNTDAGGAGEQYIYLQPEAGHIGIGGNDPGWNGEQQAGAYGNLSTQTNIHVTAVFNTQANWIAVYTNGVLAGKNTATTWQLYNNVNDALSYIGRSLFNGDAYMDVNLDEFRIYNGALTSQGIAISDAAGPGSIPAGVTNGPGTLLSLTIQAPALQLFQSGSIKLLANYTGLTNWDIIGNSIFSPAGLTISVSDTNVITSNGGVLTGVGVGTASVITVYQGITNTAQVTVTQASAPVLAHRYSFFNEPDGSLVATDSIAGFDGSLQGSSSITGGQLVLDGTSGYLTLPAGVIANNGTNSNYPTLTVETWVTFGAVGVNDWFWGFGNTDAGGAGEQYISCNPQSTRVNITDADPGWKDEIECAATGNWSGQNMHIVAVYNQPAGYEALYTNGVLAANVALAIPMSSVSNALGYIGKSLYNGDPFTPCSVSEFRIYNGVMSPNDVAATQVLGPTNTLTSNPGMKASLSGANLNLAWPVSAGSYAVQFTTNLTSHVWTIISTPQAQVVGNQWQVSVPNSGGARFYRLTR